MAIIDPEGLFGGDRLRRCSNAAQLHWPRLFLASDGFARLEINYARIIGRAYPTFSPIPSETELQAYFQEYAKNYLLFLYRVDGQVWGQWDTRKEMLPRYKTGADRRSPVPHEPAFIEWKRRYREETKSFPKCFGNISESFLHGVGVGVGVGVGEKHICASPDGNARVGSGSLFPADEPSLGNADGTPEPEPVPEKPAKAMATRQGNWFDQWWAGYWLHKAKKKAWMAFCRHVKTEARFQQVVAATLAQSPEMLSREPSKRPYGASWLNAERWEDEVQGGETEPTYRPLMSAGYPDVH